MTDQSVIATNETAWVDKHLNPIATDSSQMWPFQTAEVFLAFVFWELATWSSDVFNISDDFSWNL